MPKITRSLTVLALAALLLAACQGILPGPASPTEDTAPKFTQAASTIIAQLTEAAPPATATVEPTLAPTEPILPTATVAPTATTAPTATQAPTAAITATLAVTVTAPVTGAVATAEGGDAEAGGGILPTGGAPTEAAPTQAAPAATGEPGFFSTLTPTGNAPAAPTAAAATATPAAPAATPKAITTGTPGSAATAAPTGPAPTLAPPADYEIVYEDDFSGSVFWPTERNDDWGLRFAQGGYLVTVGFTNDVVWSVKSQIYTDTIVEVDASRVSGPTNGYFGVVCRHQNGNNYYALVVASDGSYGILKERTGQISWLFESTAPSTAILANGVNRVRGSCVGNTLTLFVNGQQLAQVEDNDFPTGTVGVAAGTRWTDDLEALFDNFVIWAPEE